LSVRVTVVVPFKNALSYLRLTVPQVLEARGALRDIELIYVDNGSTDGSRSFLEKFGDVTVIDAPAATIGHMRNFGAAFGSGTYLSFLDADCGVSANYFETAVDALHRSGADATGCEYALPEHPHWIERALVVMHYMGREREAAYVNAGNFFITRAAFMAVGGFREDLVTGEDSDIGMRLRASGYRIFESPRVEARHYGNPKSLGQHYRRSVWHALGMFATVTSGSLNRPFAMMIAHAIATAVGVAVLLNGQMDVAMRVAIAVLLQLMVPTLTVAYRVLQTKRLPSLGPAIVLYWLYYWARLHALVLIGLGRGHAYHK
jgi:glycosyltransferase involved in cell wall biosynthesis